MMDYSLAVSVAGALISFAAVVCVGIIGFLVKYVLSGADRRINLLESKLESHSAHIASAITQTQTDQRMLQNLETSIGELRGRVEILSTQIATLIGSMAKRSPVRK